MPSKYIDKNYVKYNKGNGYISCHVDALHAAPPAADQFTDKIAEGIMNTTGCAGIISKISRTTADLNRLPNSGNAEAIEDYREAIKDILEFLAILDPHTGKLMAPYLHLSFHGMKDKHHGPFAIELGTLRGRSCSKEMRDWLKTALLKRAKECFPELEIVCDKKFVGNKSISFHRLGDGESYLGYGGHFHTFQIEISRTLRKRQYRLKLIQLFSQVILDFQSEFVANEQH
jgi:hypothetical protein